MGALSGVLVARLRIPALIVTLGTWHSVDDAVAYAARAQGERWRQS